MAGDTVRKGWVMISNWGNVNSEQANLSQVGKKHVQTGNYRDPVTQWVHVKETGSGAQ